MLEFIKDRTSRRKLQLFAVACCRRVLDRITENALRLVVELAERSADGEAAEAELKDAERAAWTIRNGPADSAAGVSVLESPFAAAQAAAHYAAWAVPSSPRATERAHQAALLRCLIGSHHASVMIDPSWLAWSDGLVVKLAHTIYNKRAFDLLPILADALEDSGCTEEAVLSHCREPGPHARGCHLVDLLLGLS
jgi:hypothetical protein